MEHRTGATKKLIRNTRQQLPKINSDKEQHRNVRDVDEKTTRLGMANLNLDVPQPNATLNVAKKIQCIGKSKKIPDSVDDMTKQAVLHDKITKLVNFPFDKPIYKNLIPLTVHRTPEPTPSPRNPLPRKDKVPVLSDFMKPKPSVEYGYKVEPTIRLIEPNQKHDPFKIDRLIRNW